MDDNITYGVFWKNIHFVDDEWHPFMTWLLSYDDAYKTALEAADNPSTYDVKIVERVETYTGVCHITKYDNKKAAIEAWNRRATDER